MQNDTLDVPTEEQIDELLGIFKEYLPKFSEKEIARIRSTMREFLAVKGSVKLINVAEIHIDSCHNFWSKDTRSEEFPKLPTALSSLNLIVKKIQMREHLTGELDYIIAYTVSKIRDLLISSLGESEESLFHKYSLDAPAPKASAPLSNRVEKGYKDSYYKKKRKNKREKYRPRRWQRELK